MIIAFSTSHLIFIMSIWKKLISLLLLSIFNETYIVTNAVVSLLRLIIQYIFILRDKTFLEKNFIIFIFDILYINLLYFYSKYFFSITTSLFFKLQLLVVLKIEYWKIFYF